MEEHPRQEQAPEARERPDGATGRTDAATPTWVKVFGATLGVLVLVILALQVTGLGGEHGPARHLPAGAPAEHTAPPEHLPPGGQAAPGGHLPSGDHGPAQDHERQAPHGDQDR